MSSETRLVASAARSRRRGRLSGSQGGEPRMITSQIFGYFSPCRGETVIPLDVDVTHAYGGERARREIEDEGEREDLPSVDSLGELVAFQGPPKLTALDISPLHIPRHFHHQRSDVTRGALQERKKMSRGSEYTPRLRGIHTLACEKTRALSRARDFYQSLLLSFVCGGQILEVSRRFTKQLIGPSRDMALNQRREITCRLH